MKTASYSLMTVGMTLALGGVVAVFDFGQPSDTFSTTWWMIVGGWCLALTGMGIDVTHMSRIVNRRQTYVFHSETKTAKGVAGEVTRM